MSLLPFRKEGQMSLSDLQDQINLLMSRFYHSGLSTGPLDGQDWAPAIDAYELPDCYIVTAEVPGLRVEDIEVTFAGNTLTFKGEKTADVGKRPEKGGLCRERRFGSFTRSVTIPDPVSEADVSASCRNGILEVVLPKTEAARPKAIKINVED
jgi:HSP20 family protein